jgi:hypothetical protein
MIKNILAILAVMIFTSIFSMPLYAQDEQIELVTYYPAPYGEYDSLSVGSGYVAPAEDGRLIVNDRVGIGTDDPQAVLDVMSTISGFLPPRNANPAGNIAVPQQGMVIYNTTSNRLEYFNGTNWLPVGHGAINLDTDSYIGDGVDGRKIQIALTTEPRVVMVLMHGGKGVEIRTIDMPGSNVSNTVDTSKIMGGGLSNDRILNSHADGSFRIGYDKNVNKIGITYYYIAIS